MADVELKFRGVRKRKWGKYVSEIRLPNSRERIWLGSYDTAEKAARAFDAALFCLRGSSAKFNLSHDPPYIAGGQSLSPTEIQTVAQQFGNSYGGTTHQQQVAVDGGSSEATPPVDLINDGSFWEMVDMNGSAGYNAGGSVSELGYSPEPGEMYMHHHHPHYEARVYEDGGDEEEQGNVHYSLWNFST